MNSDQELFRSIYVHYRPLLLVAAKRNGIPYDELDDIVQETFTSYYSHYPLDWSECQIRGMLMKILKCRCIDYLRRQNRLPLTYLDPIDLEEGELKTTDKMEEKDALEIVLEEQRHQKIKDVLGKLKPDWSEVFIKLMIEGRSVADVSRELGITESACRARLSRANQYLRTQLQGYEPKVMQRREKNEKKISPEKPEQQREVRQESPGTRSIGPPRECLN